MGKRDRRVDAGVTRRTFAGALAGGLAASRTLRAQSKPPNILLITTSGHRGDALGAASHALVRTPVIDLLAKNGVYLRNVYSAAPASAPGQASLLTGRYPASHGVTADDGGLPTVEASLPELLRERGYRTWLSGRYGLDGAGRAFDGKYEFPADYAPELRNKHPQTNGDPYETGDPVKSPLWVYGASTTPFADYPTYRITDEAVGFVEGADQSKPWFVMAGYAGPHPPFVVPLPWNRRYDMELVAPPELPDEPPTPEMPGAVRRDYALAQDVREVRYAMGHYFGSISFIDEEISRLLRAVTSTDQINDTLVVFASDHGLMLGEHGRMFASAPYEGALHVPTVFYWREHLEPLQSKSVLDTTSIVPTILDIAGLEPAAKADGKSVEKIVTGAEEEGPGAAFAQLGFETVRTADWKLTLPADHPTWVPQLFHLAEDRGEETNLFDDPEAAPVRKELEAKLKDGLPG